MRLTQKTIVVLVSIVLLSLAPSAAAVASESPPGADYSGLGSSWSDRWSYGGEVTREAGSATFTAASSFSGFYVGTSTEVIGVATVASVVVIASGAGLDRVNARVVDSAKKTYGSRDLAGYMVGRNGEWVQYSIPVGDFVGAKDIAGIKLQAASGGVIPPFAVRSISVKRSVLASERSLYSAPNYEAAVAQTRLRAAGRLGDAESLNRIVTTPTAVWLGGWLSAIDVYTASLVKSADAAGAIPQIVLYNIPLRDCSGRGPVSPAQANAYRAWVDGVRSGLGTTKAIVIIEPDALSHIPSCLSSAGAAQRIELISYAVSAMSAQGSSVYVDGGNSAWLAPKTIAPLLQKVGVGANVGFALNVSNFKSTVDQVSYGSSISSLVPGEPGFVIDVSRNGATVAANLWCNPPGQRLGPDPTLTTEWKGVDALLWVKRPGESDGTCEGGPSAGAFWLANALELSAG